jgi:hypothetical protein
MNTDMAILSAASALLGTIIGGVISYFTTRYTISQQHRHDLRTRELEKRESLYSDFLAEVTRLGMLSITQKASDATEFIRLASLQARIKLLATNEVAVAAGVMTSFTVKKFSEKKEPNNEAQNKENAEAEKFPLQFIALAKKELEERKEKF